MASRPLQETVNDMRSFIERKTAAGFYTPDEVERDAVAVFVDDQPPEVLSSLAEQLTREATAAHLAAQNDWPTVTDCDLLDRAFGELERAGIVRRQDFTCCGT